jgi:hypothetical protein
MIPFAPAFPIWDYRCATTPGLYGVFYVIDNEHVCIVDVARKGKNNQSQVLAEGHISFGQRWAK